MLVGWSVGCVITLLFFSIFTNLQCLSIIGTSGYPDQFFKGYQIMLFSKTKNSFGMDFGVNRLQGFLFLQVSPTCTNFQRSGLVDVQTSFSRAFSSYYFRKIKIDLEWTLGSIDYLTSYNSAVIAVFDLKPKLLLTKSTMAISMRPVSKFLEWILALNRQDRSKICILHPKNENFQIFWKSIWKWLAMSKIVRSSELVRFDDPAGVKNLHTTSKKWKFSNFLEINLEVVSDV